MTGRLVSPCGGRLVSLCADEARVRELTQEGSGLPSVRLSERAVCDLELLATGAFSPLDRFMGRADYERVIGEMRLASGHLFPMPITLPLPDDPSVRRARRIALRDSRNDLLAIMTIDEAYDTDLDAEAAQVLGTRDVRHPLVAEMRSWGRMNLSGTIEVVQLPKRHDFRSLRWTPAETRAHLATIGRSAVVAFQTRNPLHRVHEELTKRAASELDGVLLLHPVVGLTKPGDVDHFTRVRTYKALVERYYDPGRTVLALLPLAMRMAGPREALWHALIRRNYGVSHFIVGRDHASPGLDSNGNPFYDPYGAQELVAKHGSELGVSMVPFREMVFLPDEARYEEISRIPTGTKTLSISGTQVRDKYLNAGKRLPEWFTRPEVAEILGDAYPARHRQGFCVWFTGLSGAGKSTTADILTVLLLEHGRAVTVLDGDVVRTQLSKGLGFSKEDRDTNIRRIGFVSAEIVRHGGATICAAVSPYRATRDECRQLIGADSFIEVFVDTPLDVCEERDPKKLYAKARSGGLAGFTGIDDPYESPVKPEIVLDTVAHSAEENARRIVAFLIDRGFLDDRSASGTPGT